MKRFSFVTAVFLLLAFFSACSSAPDVNMVPSTSLVNISGRWNDANVRIVSEHLITSCLGSARVDQFIKEYMANHDGKLPACLVGSFKNESSEHIDTSIISKQMEIAIVNSGKMDFVAGGDTLEEIRAERQDQMGGQTSMESEVSQANETGAILLLTGSVKSIVERAGNRTIRSYFVNAELTNIETRTRLWMDENSEIKMDVRQAGLRP